MIEGDAGDKSPHQRTQPLLVRVMVGEGTNHGVGWGDAGDNSTSPLLVFFTNSS